MHYRGEGVDQNYEQVKYCLEKVCTEDNPEKADQDSDKTPLLGQL